MVEPDPYCWPGSECLKNKLSITDQARLRVVEARIAAGRDVLISTNTIPGEYNLGHFKAFHRELFQDVYEWAGETRTVNISLPGSTFASWRYVDEDLSSVLRRLATSEGMLAGRSREGFVSGLAYFYGEINARHPFREGNGRTQRAFLRQVAAAAGWRIDWSGIDRGRNVEASRKNLRSGEMEPLVEILNPVIYQI